MSETQRFIDDRFVGMKDLRLNIGCGKWCLDGWFNIDIAVSPLAKKTPELLCDIRSIPLPDACAVELMAIHVLEHVLRWDVEATLKEWARLLKPGGRMVLEMPDIIKCCRNVVNGLEGKKPDQLGMWGIFGDVTLGDERMLHRWGYTFKTLAPMVAAVGLVDVTEQRTMFHQSGRDVRDFRLEAVKRA